MERISISEFKRAGPRLLARLPAGGLVITRRGRPVARVIPLPADPRKLIGSVPDLRVRRDDDLLGTGLRWDAQS
jgi:antitoxin (DNA-binding transcriptional repressor) of toxin-antitoxin stability system